MMPSFFSERRFLYLRNPEFPSESFGEHLPDRESDVPEHASVDVQREQYKTRLQLARLEARGNTNAEAWIEGVHQETEERLQQSSDDAQEDVNAILRQAA